MVTQPLVLWNDVIQHHSGVSSFDRLYKVINDKLPPHAAHLLLSTNIRIVGIRKVCLWAGIVSYEKKADNRVGIRCLPLMFLQNTDTSIRKLCVLLQSW